MPFLFPSMGKAIFMEPGRAQSSIRTLQAKSRRRTLRLKCLRATAPTRLTPSISTASAQPALTRLKGLMSNKANCTKIKQPSTLVGLFPRRSPFVDQQEDRRSIQIRVSTLTFEPQMSRWMILQPLIEANIPLTGLLSAQIDANGPIKKLNGNGSVDLDRGAVYGEPVAHIRAEGKIVNQVVQIAKVTVNDEAGNITGWGSYDIPSHKFHLDARAAALDLAKIQRIRDQNLQVAGNLGFSITSSGTFDDPRLEGHATMTGLVVSGEPFGGVEVFAHAENHKLTYDIKTRLEATDFLLTARLI